MLSHGAMLRNCASCDKLLESLTSDLTKEIRYLSWLPLSHSYEHTLQFLEMGPVSYTHLTLPTIRSV